MKKLVSLLLAILMLLALIPAGAETTPAGTWYLVEVSSGSVSLQPSALGMKMILVLNEDGSADISTTYGEETTENKGTWAFEGNQVTISQDEGSISLTLEEDRLILTQEGGSMIFSQNPDAVPAASEINPVAAENEEAYLGTWALVQGRVNGILLPGEALGLKATIIIEPGSATIDYDGQKYTSPTQFADGKLQCTDDDGTVTVFIMNDNGQISITVDSNGTEVVMYFEKTV